MNYPPAFLSLIGELERFELSPRNRIRDGEAFCGRVRSTFTISASACADAAPPPPTGAIRSKLEMRASIRVGARLYSEFVAEVARERANAAPAKPLKGRKPRPAALPKPKRSPRPYTPKGPAGWSRTAVENAAAKARQEREARIAAVLPIVEEANAAGCHLLSEICAFLDDRGVLPLRGKKWNVATLTKMMPDRAHEMRLAIDTAIEQAKAVGAVSYPQIAAWLNLHGHRTKRGGEWSSPNVWRWMQSRKHAG